MVLAERSREESPSSNPRVTRTLHLFENGNPEDATRLYVISRLSAFVLLFHRDSPGLTNKDIAEKSSGMLSEVIEAASDKDPLLDLVFVHAALSAMKGDVFRTETFLENERGKLVRPIKAFARLVRLTHDELRAAANGQDSPSVDAPLILIAKEITERIKQKPRASAPAELIRPVPQKKDTLRTPRFERKRMSVTEELRTKIKGLRLKLGFSQYDVLGRNRQPTYSAIERGQTKDTSVKTLEQIAARYNTTVDILLDPNVSVNEILEKRKLTSIAVEVPVAKSVQPETIRAESHRPPVEHTVFEAPKPAQALSEPPKREGPSSSDLKKSCHELEDTLRDMREKGKNELTIIKDKDRELEVVLLASGKFIVRRGQVGKELDLHRLLFELPWNQLRPGFQRARYELGRKK